jgi:CheY-like chemotaxis protein
VSSDPSLLPILIADDESDDRFFLEKALRKAGVKNPIIEFHDGANLVEFLTREAAALKPLHQIATLLFLDIKMPLVDGFDTMRWIRENAAVKLLRIVIVSGSRLPKDQEQASRLGAFRYLEKYPSADTLAQLMADTAEATPPGSARASPIRGTSNTEH